MIGKNFEHQTKHRPLLLALFAIALLIFMAVNLTAGISQSAPATHEQQLAYDIVVVGSEPEGIIAAVAAAENGARTLLITEDPKVGGLFVRGQMNVLDLRTQPFNYQQGLFLRWWRMVGLGHSFDVQRAEAAFLKLLQDAGVTIRLSSPAITPLMEGKRVIGIRVAAGATTEGGTILAGQVIDATSEMDFAAASGASYTVGFASLGYAERMVDTLVFKIDGIDWQAFKRGIQQRGRNYASVDNWVAWGHFGGYMAAYESQEPGLRMRGLNIGLQEDGSALVNALLIYGIDPLDPASIAEGHARAAREVPRIVDYLKQDLPGFVNARAGGVADALYIRETRHLDALCLLTIDDVLNNRVTELDIAAGGYPLDVQTLTPHDSGFVFGTPEIYGVQLCVNVPQGIDNLWVVGKAAGYDPIAASSARVVPFGMAVAEAVGIAAAQAQRSNITPAVFVKDPNFVQAVRSLLLQRGAYLPQVRTRNPVGPFSHPFYADYRLMVSRGLAVAGYDNDPQLAAPMQGLGYVYLLSNIAQRFWNDADFGKALVAQYAARVDGQPLTPDLALDITRDAACHLGVCVNADWAELTAQGLVPSSFVPGEVLSRGEMYALAARLALLNRLAEE